MSVQTDLAIARDIVRAGIPVILWRRDSRTPPRDWPNAVPDLSVIDAWQPGDKLYVVTGARTDGRGVDIVDVDPRNGGVVDPALAVEAAAVASTPSGGTHLWLPTANVRKGSPGPGIDYLAGTTEGKGRGLAAIPPTHGSLTSPNADYRWTAEPHLPVSAALSHSQSKMVAALLRSEPPKGDVPSPKLELPAVARASANAYEQKYIQAKLHDKFNKLVSQSAARGTWDITVFGAARDLVKLANAGWSSLTHDEALRIYTEACEQLKDGNADWEYRMANKFERAIAEVEVAYPMPAEVGNPDSVPNSLTDDGNATLFVDVTGEDVRYVPTAKTPWHVWNGSMWVPDDANKVQELAKEVLRELPESNRDLINHKKRSLNIGGIRAALALASSDERIVVEQNAFDAETMKLNTPGGVVDLATGILEPHNRDEMHSKVTICTPDSEAPMPKFNKFMADTFKSNPELISFMQRVYGYSISGSAALDFLPFLYGQEGNNGKTVMAATLAKILNTYAGYAPSGLLTLASYNHESVKATLYGKRLMIVTEESEDVAFNESRVKEYTGGEPLTACFKHKDEFTWNPTHKIWVLANSKPSVKTGGNSFWRRVKLVEFLHVVKKEDEIKDLEDIMVAEEGPAILAWAIQGAVEVFKNGLQFPESLVAATAAYAMEEDHFTRFVMERGTLGEDERCLKSDLRQDYVRWCENEGIKPKTAKEIGRHLASKHMNVRVGGNGGNSYYGISLKYGSPFSTSAVLASTDDLKNLLN